MVFWFLQTTMCTPEKLGALQRFYMPDTDQIRSNSKSNKSREAKFVIAIFKNKYYIKALYQHQTPEGF